MLHPYSFVWGSLIFNLKIWVQGFKPVKLTDRNIFVFFQDSFDKKAK